MIRFNTDPCGDTRQEPWGMGDGLVRSQWSVGLVWLGDTRARLIGGREAKERAEGV